MSDKSEEDDDSVTMTLAELKEQHVDQNLVAHLVEHLDKMKIVPLTQLITFSAVSGASIGRGALDRQEIMRMVEIAAMVMVGAAMTSFEHFQKNPGEGGVKH